MTTEDQIVALFAEANPVPSLDVFDPVEPLDIRHLTTRSERSSAMTDTNTDRPRVKPTIRWPRLALAVAVAVIAAVSVAILINRNNRVIDSPESVATAFMVALAEHDGDAARELFAPDGTYGDIALSDLPVVLDHDRAIGWDYTNQGCEERSRTADETLVVCPHTLENDWLRALGLEPGQGSHEILVTEGQIQSAVETGSPQESGLAEAFRAFRTWVNTNHPDDIATMFGPGDQILRNSESIPLFERYTDEFVADTTASLVALPLFGALEPGTYYISDRRVTPGRFTFTVPAGWATEEAFVTKDLDPSTSVDARDVVLVTWIVSHVYADICDWQGTLIDAGTTVDELASVLLAQEGRVASAPTGVMLGGFPATRIELTVPADLNAANCDGGIIRFWPDPGPDESGGLCCASAGSTDVVYVVDVDGNTFAVVARHTAASSAEDRAELEAIIDSIRIDPPAPSGSTSP